VDTPPLRRPAPFPAPRGRRPPGEAPPHTDATARLVRDPITVLDPSSSSRSAIVTLLNPLSPSRSAIVTLLNPLSPCRSAIVTLLNPILIVVAVMALAAASCAIPQWPVDGTLTSPFGLRFRGASPDLHPGVDISAPAGTPVHAMKPGRVVFTGTMSGYGLTVIVDHSPNLRTLYAHLSRIDVASGEEVAHRAIIGAVGATGNATAPHLHFEITRWGRNEDPVPLLGDHPNH